MRGWKRWCTIGLVLVVALGACGDDDDDRDAAGGDSDASETAVEPEVADDAESPTAPGAETERPSTAEAVAIAFVDGAIDDGDVGDLVSGDVAGNDPLWGKAEELRRLTQATPSTVEPGDITGYGFPADPQSPACSTADREVRCAVELPGLGIVTLVTLVPSTGDGSRFAVTGLDYDVPNQLEEGTASASEQFVSPSGNIACRIDADAATCEIAEFDFEPPTRPAGCDLDWGGRLVVGPVDATLSCHGDTLFDLGSPTLSYGDSATVGDYTCTSAEDGMTCTHTPTGHGFQVRRSSYHLF